MKILKPFFDRILEKTVSKKLTVFFIATGLCLWGSIDGNQWVNVAMIYIGGQSVIDTVIKLRGKNEN